MIVSKIDSVDFDISHLNVFWNLFLCITECRILTVLLMISVKIDSTLAILISELQSETRWLLNMA